MGSDKDLKEILIPADRIQDRITELGRQIAAEYAGKNLFMVAILKGAAIFLADLARHIDIPATFDFMAVSSYGAATKSSGAVRIIKDIDQPMDGRDVLIVEDIVDTGLTLNYLTENFRARNPKSLKVCTLLDKKERRQVPVRVDYCGFSIPNEFVVGYGLDYREFYRNLPMIGVLKPEVYEADTTGKNGGAK
ncbi:MAG TPA: hypoxanthine phosphoribosyltransferase [Bacillota bacterium]